MDLLTDLHNAVRQFFPDSSLDAGVSCLSGLFGASSRHGVFDWVVSPEWDFLMRDFLPHFFGCRGKPELSQIFTCDNGVTRSKVKSWNCPV